MELQGTLAETNALKEDERDLFVACVAIGQVEEEYDAETGKRRTRFRRNQTQWRPALTQIRKCVLCSVHCLLRLVKSVCFRRLLKKYYRHEDLPARRWLAKFFMLRSKFLPMIEEYYSDT